jgi:hypothetical protein
MLPKKVREQAERAEALHRQVYGNTANDAAPGESAAPRPEQGEVMANQAAAPTAPGQPTEFAAAPADDTWEKKYRVLEGKYNAEVPRMAAQLRELRDEIEALRSAPAPAAPAVPQTELGGMTPEDVVEQFGEDFAKAVGAVAARIASQNTDALRQEFQPKLESVEKTTMESARAEFLRELSRLVPDWKAIDQDDGFTAFLDETDPLTGRSRRFFFKEADKHMDAARIAQFFQAFKGNSNPALQAPAVNGPSAIELQLQPSSNRSSPQSPQGKRYWTSADVRQFYVDVRKGRFTPQEAKRIESDIFAAQRENRFAA